MKALASRSLTAFLMATSLSLVVIGAQAREFKKGALTIEKPYATATAPGQPNGAIFIKEIRNSAAQADELIGATSAASKTVEVHRMSMENNVMVMREIPGIAVPASGNVSMDRGSKEGFHLMLMGLAKPLKEGDRFSATLIFRKAGEVTITVPVTALKASGHDHHQKH